MRGSTSRIDTTEAGGHLSTSQFADALGVGVPSGSRVTLDTEALGRVASHISARRDFFEFTRARWDDPMFWNVESTPVERSQFFAVGNSINFRFWTLGEDRIVPAVGTILGQQFRGAMYMWRSLRVAVDRGVPLLDPAYLKTISDADFDAIFMDDSGSNPLRVALDERLHNLRDLGHKLGELWDGQFYNLVDATGGSLVQFARFSAGFRAFDDPIFKLTMVNAILHSGSGVAEFDADPLPGIDYQLLKHLMRQGILVPNSDIRTKIASKQLLTSEEAFELRGMALHAFIELSSLTGLSGEVIDNKYWWNRQNCADDEPVCVDPSTADRCPFYGSCARLLELAVPLELTRYY